MTQSTKYPHVIVRLSGEDGNAFFIMGRVSSALKKAGIPKEEVQAFLSEAQRGDYNNLLQVVMRTVTTT